MKIKKIVSDIVYGGIMFACGLGVGVLREREKSNDAMDTMYPPNVGDLEAVCECVAAKLSIDPEDVEVVEDVCMEGHHTYLVQVDLATYIVEQDYDTGFMRVSNACRDLA